MNRRNKYLLITLGIVVLACLAIGGPLAVTLTDQQKQEQAQPPLDLASKAVNRFMDRYVQADGRVVRTDQGNDTVSEGQAYGMLIAVGAGDRTRFDAIWNWSRNNLLQQNGLMAWRWQDGKVVDTQPATDADMDAARALVVASTKFKDSVYAEQGRALAKAIADNDLAYSTGSKPVLLAGPWAKTAPFYANPSYHSPRTEALLADFTKDTRWSGVLQGERMRTSQLINFSGDDIKLPPDWSTVDGNTGAATAAPSPSDKGAEPKYSYDAVRLPIRLAESCDATDKAQAAKLWSILNRSQSARTSVDFTLDGDITTKSQTAIGAVAAAAGAHAAGDTDQELNLLDLADRIDTNTKTYYGAAWVALGRIMLTTNWLGNCN